MYTNWHARDERQPPKDGHIIVGIFPDHRLYLVRWESIIVWEGKEEESKWNIIGSWNLIHCPAGENPVIPGEPNFWIPIILPWDIANVMGGNVKLA